MFTFSTLRYHTTPRQKYLLCILQALTKLLDESSQNVSGQIFYLTDDNPVNCYYVLEPLYKKLHHRDAPNPIPVPIIVQLIFAFVFHALSLLLGPKFKLPYWGFTFMECYKVIILKFKKIYIIFLLKFTE